VTFPAKAETVLYDIGRIKTGFAGVLAVRIDREQFSNSCDGVPVPIDLRAMGMVYFMLS